MFIEHINIIGHQAIQLIVEDGRKIINSVPPSEQMTVQKLCSDTENLSRQLAEMCRHGEVSVLASIL